MSNSQQQDRLTTFDTDEQTVEAIEKLAENTTQQLHEADQVDIDSLFDLLSHPGRRYILTYLLQSDGYVTCNELVDYVVDVTDHTMTDRQFRKRVTAELTHSHLPKLEDANFIDYNMERQIVAQTDTTDLARPYITLALAQQSHSDD